MSFWEFIVIIIVALMVIKPERLPEIAYLMGSLVRRCRMLYQQIFRPYDR
jgi:Sec-independent protein translocase protein TatA